MEERKYTPGKWHIATIVFNKPIEPHEALAVWDETHGQKEDSILGRPICILSPIEKLNPMDEANAHLISAAPELLEACQKAFDIVNGGYGSRTPNETMLLGILRSAISKATKRE